MLGLRGHQPPDPQDRERLRRGTPRPVERHPRRDRADVHGARSTDRHGRLVEGARAASRWTAKPCWKRSAGCCKRRAPRRSRRRRRTWSTPWARRAVMEPEALPASGAGSAETAQQSDPLEGIKDEERHPGQLLVHVRRRGRGVVGRLDQRTAGPGGRRKRRRTEKPAGDRAQDQRLGRVGGAEPRRQAGAPDGGPV